MRDGDPTSALLAGRFDCLLEGVVSDGAIQHAVANDEEGSARRAEPARDLEIALELGLDRRVLRRRGGDVRDPRRRGIGVRSGPAGGVERVVELAEAPGLRRGEREPSSLDAVVPEDGQLAIDDAKARLFLEQPVDVRIARFAIGSGVIVELYEDDFGLLGTLP